MKSERTTARIVQTMPQLKKAALLEGKPRGPWTPGGGASTSPCPVTSALRQQYPCSSNPCPHPFATYFPESSPSSSLSSSKHIVILFVFQTIRRWFSRCFCPTPSAGCSSWSTAPANLPTLPYQQCWLFLLQLLLAWWLHE